MYIFLFLLIFVIGAVGAARKGDYSGTIFIGKVLMGIGLFLVFGCILSGFSTNGAGEVFLFSLCMTALGVFLAAKE
ncbi:MAG: hypothetical protein IIY55_08175 [Blautia sp.]|nr:hypothetical protein [Blautia sp.]